MNSIYAGRENGRIPHQQTVQKSCTQLKNDILKLISIMFTIKSDESLSGWLRWGASFLLNIHLTMGWINRQ